MTLVVMAFLVGAAVGLIFRVWALVPITAVAAIATLGGEFVLGTDFTSAVASSCIAVVTLELGYGFGLLVRYTDGLVRNGSGAATKPLTKSHPLNRV